MNVLELTLNVLCQALFGKKTIKMAGHHARLRDVMGQFYPMYTCTHANHECYSSDHVRFCGSQMNSLLKGEKLNCKSVAKEISKPPFLAPEVQWASKFTVFVRFTFPLNVSNHAHIWYVT